MRGRASGRPSCSVWRISGYGAAGGGLGIVDVQAGQVEMLEHQEIVSGQSTISLAVLPDGRVFGAPALKHLAVGSARRGSGDV